MTVTGTFLLVRNLPRRFVPSRCATPGRDGLCPVPLFSSILAHINHVRRSTSCSKWFRAVAMETSSVYESFMNLQTTILHHATMQRCIFAWFAKSSHIPWRGGFL